MIYGIVSEFNPFHNGHEYLINSIKKDGDFVIAVMSESFVQRGESAVLRTSPRVKAALLNGVDIVLSLPVTYSVSSAEKFAYGGIKILNSSGVVNKIAFGAETDDKEKLSKCAEALLSEDFEKVMAETLKSGVSYPKARETSLKNIYGEDFANIISTPNNILGVEYIKAIKKLNSSMDFCCVKRKGANHDEKTEKGFIKSASQIREELLKGDTHITAVPENAREIYIEEIKAGKAPADFKKLEMPMLSSLRMKSEEDFNNLPDVSEGLNNRLLLSVASSTTVADVLEKCKTKRYTYSRLKRILLCDYLGITKEIAQKDIPYIRVLGFTEKGEKLFGEIKKKSTLPVVTNYGDVKKQGKGAAEFFEFESKAKDLFSLTLPKPDICNTLMTDKIIKIKG